MDGGGEGLYAVRDIEKDEIVAFYNGVGWRYFKVICIVIFIPGTAAIQTWGEGKLGNFWVQNICEC